MPDEVIQDVIYQDETNSYRVEGWRRLPLALRQRWWQQTSFGQRPPPSDLVGEITRHLRTPE